MAEISFVAYYGPVALHGNGTLELARRRPDIRTTHSFTSPDMQEAHVSLCRICLVSTGLLLAKSYVMSLLCLAARRKS